MSKKTQDRFIAFGIIATVIAWFAARALLDFDPGQVLFNTFVILVFAVMLLAKLVWLPHIVYGLIFRLIGGR
jgi:hypothetical protein